MSERLVFPDPASAHDALTFAERAGRAGAEGVHLVANGGLLRMSAAMLTTRGPADLTPLVLGLRFLRVDPALSCDMTVGHLGKTTDPAALGLPASAFEPPWSKLPIPREGWQRTSTVSGANLRDAAQAGIRSVAEAVPHKAGEDIVRKIRSTVWGAPEESIGLLPRGVAFAAFALGLLDPDQEATVHTAGRWRRVTLQAGHILLYDATSSTKGVTPYPSSLSSTGG